MSHVFRDPENKNQIRSPDKAAKTNAESTQATNEMSIVAEAHDNEESSLSDETKAAIRTEYREDRAALKEGEQRHADSFDKLALAILTGALGLSVAFVKDIAPKPDPGTVWMLLLGWGILTVGLLASLIGIYLAQLSYKRQLEIRDEEHRIDMGERKEEDVNLSNVYSVRAYVANVVVIIAIVAGVTLVLAFAGSNYSRKVNMDNQQIHKIISHTPGKEPGATGPAGGRGVPIVNQGTKTSAPKGGGEKGGKGK